uniref:Uncharacterized protein n=1 Tax=Rhizophora mucronata TaxID=61149 RepID=A0A2P2J828_RHIMU
MTALWVTFTLLLMY